jgi:solute carrier family 25, member 39/40
MAGIRRGKKVEPRIMFVSCAISGMTAALITQPFDVLKTKTRQNAFLMDIAGGAKARSGSIYLVRRVLSTEGVLALFEGVTPPIKIALACSVMIAFFEVCSVLLWP